MAQELRLLPGRITGLAARQPRIAIGSLGIGTILLADLMAFVIGHALA